MNKINEGQTQVYMNGGVDPQFGVNTTAPYLNNPPQQLMDLIREFKRSGKSDAQTLAILVGMGTPQQLALSGIGKYNAAAMHSASLGESKQKNNIKMNFTLIDLYEKVNSAIDSLKEMTSDSSRVSYSAKNALNILENSLKSFPGVKLENGKMLSNFNEENFAKIKEEFEAQAGPLTKYYIAKSIYNDISSSAWLNPVNELKTYLDEVYASNKWSFKISEAIVSLASRSNPLHERLEKDLFAVLNESDVVASFKKVTKSNPWSTELARILNEMNVEENKSISQREASVSRIFSPILEENGGVYFNLHGKNYFMKDNTIEEAVVTDVRYNTISEVLSMASINEDTITFFGYNDKSLDYNMNEGTLKLGDSLDLSDSSILEIRNAMLSNRFFHYAESNKVDKLCIFFENINMLTEMDNFLSLSSNEHLGLYLTMIAVEEGVWINKINPGMKVNEMKYFTSAETALTETKSFIGYDATAYLSEMLIAEGNSKAIAEKKRAEINNRLSFLEEKKNDITATIQKIGESEELAEALNLINTEIELAEKALQETYAVSEKKLSKSEVEEYANDGYVEATLNSSVGPNFKKGAKIMVNAEEYASLGKGDLLKIINPETGESKLIDKGNLSVDI
jgi:hypothetical protein